MVTAILLSFILNTSVVIPAQFETETTKIAEEIPQELQEELYAQKGRQIEIIEAYAGWIQKLFIGDLYLIGLMRFTPDGDLHIVYVSFAMRLDKDGKVVYIYHGLRSKIRGE